MSGVGLTVYGVTALVFMMSMYALERRNRVFILAFAVGCMLASSYGFLSGAWPFGAVEATWSRCASPGSPAELAVVARTHRTPHADAYAIRRSGRRHGRARLRGNALGTDRAGHPRRADHRLRDLAGPG